MIGCDSEPLQSAYGLLRSGDEVVQVITPISDGSDVDGTFSTIIVGCQNGNYSIQFFDPENIKSTGIIDISNSVEVNDLGNVMICDEVDEYIEVTREGDETIMFSNANVYFSNQEKLIITGIDPNSITYFQLEVFAQEEGSYNPTNLYIDSTVGFGPGYITVCGDYINNYYGCSELSVEITKFDTYIEGTFSGLLMERMDTAFLEIPIIKENFTEGSFRLKIDQFINMGEISGKLWVDENNNDTREDNETKAGPLVEASIRKLDSPEPIYQVPLILYQGFYKFSNLLPGNYIVDMQGASGYFAVNKDVGSDDRDSDFNSINGSRFETDEININTNEIIENVDLGFQVPDSMSCGNIMFDGCSPSILVSTTVSGGLLPLTASLNGGELVSFGNVVTFDVPEGGDYTILVFDNLGNTCTSSGFVNNYNNQVTGRVWKDIDGGTPNIYDENDEDLTEMIVQLFDINGEFETEVLSINGMYTINNVAPGNYFIEIVEIGSLEFVTQNTIIENGNDINPDTRRSNEFTIGNCNFSIQIDAGLK